MGTSGAERFRTTGDVFFLCLERKVCGGEKAAEKARVAR